MDPYVKIKIDEKEKRRTKTHKNGGKHPIWNEEISFRIEEHHLKDG